MRLLEASGYGTTRAAVSLGIFDVIAIDVALVQVKSNNWPDSVEMESIRNFVCPPGTKKLIHRWRDRRHAPDVRVVT